MPLPKISRGALFDVKKNILKTTEKLEKKAKTLYNLDKFILVHVVNKDGFLAKSQL